MKGAWMVGRGEPPSMGGDPVGKRGLSGSFGGEGGEGNGGPGLSGGVLYGGGLGLYGGLVLGLVGARLGGRRTNAMANSRTRRTNITISTITTNAIPPTIPATIAPILLWWDGDAPDGLLGPMGTGVAFIVRIGALQVGSRLGRKQPRDDFLRTSELTVRT
jgi:hypothetical protein